MGRKNPVRAGGCSGRATTALGEDQYHAEEEEQYDGQEEEQYDAQEDTHFSARFG